MKICIAQIQSFAGDIQKNIDVHIGMINLASNHQAKLIVFPELSLTGYEPTKAKELAVFSNDEIFEPFQTIANINKLIICVGMPIKTSNGITISMVIFQPNKERKVYSKQLLHEDELPYFVCGKEQFILEIEDYKIGFGICYESLQKDHFITAHKTGIDLYIASVAKPQNGIEFAYDYFSKLSKEFKTPILLSNGIGKSDNFISAGQSAIWNKDGQLINQLSNHEQGILIFDTKNQVSSISIINH